MAYREIARAVVTIVPQMKGMQDKVTTGLERIGKSSGLSFGKNFDSASAKGMGKLAAIAGVVGTVFSGIASSIGNMLSQSVDAAISRADTFIAFPKVMKNLGYATTDVDAALKQMDTRLRSLPTSLDSMTAIVQKIAPYSSDLDHATKVTLALNDAILANGQGTESVERATRQYVQMLAKGKPVGNDWYTLQETMGNSLNVVAQMLLGASANSETLRDALQDGTVTIEDFENALISLDENGGGGLTALKDQAVDASAGIRAGFAKISNAVVRNMANVFQIFGEDFYSVTQKISSAIDYVGAGIKDFAQGIKDQFNTEAWAETFRAFGAMIEMFFPADGGPMYSFGQAIGQMINWLAYLLRGLTPIILLVAGAMRVIADHPALIPILMVGIPLLKQFGPSLKQVIGPLETFGTGMEGAGKAGQKGVKGVKMFGRAAGNMLAFGAAILLVGAGLRLIADGIANVAQYGEAGVAALIALIGVFGVIAGTLVGVGMAAEIAIPGLLAFTAAFIGVSFGIKLVVDAISGLVTAIGEAAPGLSMIIDSIASGIATIITTLAIGTSQIFMTMANGIATVIETINTGLQGIIDSLANAFIAFGAATIDTGRGLLLIVSALSVLVGMNLFDLGASLTTAATGVGDLVSAGAGAAGAAIGLMLMASGMALAATQAGIMQSSMVTLSAGVVTAGVAFGTFAAAVNNSLAQAATRVASFVAYCITAINNMRLVIPRIEVSALPHFSLNGRFNPETGEVPRVSVQWYAQGGIFSGASLIGVGEGRYPEAVIPLSPSVLAGIGEGIQGGGTTNVYFNNTRVNSRPDIEAAFYSFMTELQRLGVMEGGV